MQSKMSLLLAISLLLAAAAPARGAIYYRETIDGYDCAGDMTTENCFSTPTGTKWSGPTTTACSAKGRDGQRCRRCAPSYDPDGNPREYNTCNFVPESAACDCTFASGETKKCSGNTASACEYSW